MNLKPRKVRKQVANNPVARAVAWAELVKKSRDAKIFLLMLNENEEARSMLMMLATHFALLQLAVQHDKLPGDELTAALHFAQRAIASMSEDGFKWKCRHATTLDDAIDAAALLVKKCTPAAIRFAQIEIEKFN